MTSSFLEKILEAHQVPKQLPGTKEVEDFIEQLLKFLFPELGNNRIKNQIEIKIKFNQLRLDFEGLLYQTEACDFSNVDSICHGFFMNIESVYNDCIEDAFAILKGDPAAKDINQVIRSYPGFFAISVYRIANLMCRLKVPYLPRILTEYAHSKTGIDIHPRSTIGKRFCIDHGTGIVIGETSNIGDDVKIYQGVTLGALSVSKEMASIKRHPTIENNVIIYSNTTILGGKTVVGENSIIGGSVWITSSIAPNSKVYYSAKDNQVIRL